MTLRTARDRSGVTLTEILISIMIMGIGVVSLATLFPLGVLRLRQANRMSRSTYLGQSAGADIGSRNLLVPSSFTPAANTPWYVTSGQVYSPFVQDTPGYGQNWFAAVNGVASPVGAYRGRGGPGPQDPFYNPPLTFGSKPGRGLPVAYDPLWRAVTGIYPAGSSATDARFGVAPSWMISLGNNLSVCADGLQRITNMPALPAPNGNALQQIYYHTATETFVSPEDIVFQEKDGKYIDPFGNGIVSQRSTVVPDLSQVTGSAMILPNRVTLYTPQTDWRYTWFFTGQQNDAFDGSIFDGQVVVCENRQFGYDPVGVTYQATGETVVWAVWGYGANVAPTLSTNLGYARAAKRAVLLLWPSSIPDPDVKVGQWIADTTYLRNEASAQTLYTANNALYPPQRCHWYQVAKRTEPGVAVVPFAPAGYRQMMVWTNVDLKAQTMMSANGFPAVVEPALVMPTVVNVIPRTVSTH
jgi:type II secretory pathway pseudopilin PulG